MIRSIFMVLLLLCGSSHGATLLILGDSLSASYGIAEQRGWISLLSGELAPQHRIVNASISGDTSGGGLARLPRLLEEYSPDFVLIELGANDGLRGAPLGLIEKNITQMIELCRRRGTQPLLFGMRIPANYGRRYSDGFANLYLAIAKRAEIPLMAFEFADITATEGMIQRDGLHPTAAAQPMIKNRVKRFLKPILAVDEKP